MEDIQCSRTWKTILFTRQYSPKVIYRVTAIPIKLPLSLLTEIDNLILKCIWNFKASRIATTIQRNKVRTQSDFPISKLTTML